MGTPAITQSDAAACLVAEFHIKFISPGALTQRPNQYAIVCEAFPLNWEQSGSPAFLPARQICTVNFTVPLSYDLCAFAVQGSRNL